jgi:hypothetical protein
VKEKESAYDFDIKKADKIFNLLLEKKQLKLPQIMLFLRLESSKGKSTTSFIVPLLIVLLQHLVYLEQSLDSSLFISKYFVLVLALLYLLDLRSY